MSGFRINTNVTALFAQRHELLSKDAINRSIERLSSGLAINRAADDAAGLAISERMRTQIEGLQQGTRNVQDGISLLQTAEGGLGTILDSLQRMRSLAVQAANDTYTDADRALIQLEVSQQTKEIDRQASTVTFNGKRLLDGSALSAVGPLITVQENYTVAENLVNITSTAGTSETHPKVSPDGSRVIYGNSFPGTLDVETRPIGGGPATVIPPGVLVFNTDPEFSPNGSRIALTGAFGDVFTEPAGGGPATNVSNGGGINNNATWSPDGTRIAFARTVGGLVNLVTANADGSGAEVIVDPSISQQPDYSPDGARIAFVTNVGRIADEPVGGGAQTPLAPAIPIFAFSPRYSPDGTLIIYQRQAAGIFNFDDIFVRNSNGTGPEVNLTNTSALFDNITPDLTPDMRRYVFSGFRPGGAGVRGDIFAANSRLFQDLAQPVTDPTSLVVTKNGVTLTQGADYSLATPTAIRYTTTGIPNVGDTIVVTHKVREGQLLIHDGADKDQIIALTLPKSRVRDLFTSGNPDVATRTNASNAITQLDNAISRVTGSLAEIGAQQNRLEAAFDRNGIETQNASSSRSRIRDLDFAAEIVAFTKQQILQQAGVSALAQANVAPQAVLQLLK